MFQSILGLFSRLVTWIQNQLSVSLLRIIRRGTPPQHVAFIMDGNRRYATKLGLADRKMGHYFGYNKFETVIDWCFQLGIKCVTVYAFSVENFKRTQDEVSALMELAIDKLGQLAERHEVIRRHRVAIRIFGELDMLPEKVREVAAKAMKATAHHTNFILNICFPFVSRLEMVRANNLYSELVKDPSLAMYDNETLYRSCLDTFDSPDIDILIRTSGEQRLSEFLVHQLCVSPNCLYQFIPSMWPEFSLLEFAVILLRFQNSHRDCPRHTGKLPLPLLSRRLKSLLNEDGEFIGR